MKSRFRLLVCATIVSLALSGCGAASPTPTTVSPADTTAPTAPTAAAVPPTATEALSTPTTASLAQATPSEQALTTVAAGTPGKLDKVRFAMDWTPNTNHTGIYVALQKGWYADQGIDLQILPYSDANTPDTLVASGQAEFGISFEESVVTDRVNKLPVKSVAAVLQTNTSALATLKSSGLNRPARLEGRRYAGFGSTYEEPVVSTVLKADGAPTGKFQNITTNVSGYQALVARQADFLWIYMGWEGIQARIDKVELNTFLLKDYKVPDYYTPVIIGNERFLQDHSDAAKRFLAATARGYEYGVSKPADAADLLIKAAPAGTFPDPALPRQSQAYLAPYYVGSQPRWGAQTLAYWTNFPKFIASTGLLKTADGQVVHPEEIDYASLFSNDYLP